MFTCMFMFTGVPKGMDTETDLMEALHMYCIGMSSTATRHSPLKRKDQHIFMWHFFSMSLIYKPSKLEIQKEAHVNSDITRTRMCPVILSLYYVYTIHSTIIYSAPDNQSESY